jgi:hypothetical protein
MPRGDFMMTFMRAQNEANKKTIDSASYTGNTEKMSGVCDMG